MPILNMNYGANKGGANIGEPTNLSVTATSDSATITWTDNDLNTIPPATFFKSVLVRKIGSAPTSPSDGTLVVTETVKNTYSSNGYTDTGLTGGTTYYYKVFSYSDLGGVTYCDAVSVTPQSGWQPGADTLVYYDFEHTSGTSEENLAATGSTYNGVYKVAPTIGTLASGKKYFDSSDSGNRSFLYTASQLANFNYDNATLCLWFVFPSNEINLFGQQRWGSPSVFHGELYQGNYSFTLGIYGNEFSGSWTGGTTRHLLTLVNDGVDANYYLDGVKINNKTLTTTPSLTQYFYLGTCPTPTETPSTVPTRGYGAYFGTFILENKARTAQEISDYYDQTKVDYGIS